MNIYELVEKIDLFTDKEREKYISKIWNMFSTLSKNEILNFQNKWDSSKSFDEFKMEQNKLIRECISIECSIVGEVVREKENLEKFDMMTVIG
jgi:hypothetical protein